MSEELQIYVACLSSYNNGILHGTWIDISDGLDDWEIDAEIQEMLKLSVMDGAEEWAVHDWDTPVTSMQLGEYHSLSELEQISQNFQEFGSMFLHVWEHMGGPVDNMRDYCEDSFLYKDWDEIIEQWLEAFDIQPPALWYIDEEKLKRDLGFEGTYIEIDDGVLEIHG